MSRKIGFRVRRLACVLAPAALVGCSASANLDDVAIEQAKPVLRSDQFQRAAGNSQVLVAVGANGVVVSSGDAGKSWNRHIVDAEAALIDLAVCPDESFVALDFKRRVWVADAAARSWSSTAITTQATPLAVTCDAVGRYWVVGSDSVIVSSADGGASWTETSLDEDVMFTTIQFIDERQGVITGEFGSLLTTRDGGASWQSGAPIPNDFYPYSAVFTDLDTGWVSGLAGTILHTRDGGANWEKQANPTGAPMYGLTRHNGELFAVGVNGLMLKLAGTDWVVVEGRAAPYLRTAYSVNEHALLVAGGAGVLEIISPSAIAASKK